MAPGVTAGPAATSPDLVTRILRKNEEQPGRRRDLRFSQEIQTIIPAGPAASGLDLSILRLAAP